MGNKSLILMASILIATGALIGYGNSTKEYEKIPNATYQGWRKANVGAIFVFDPEPPHLRKGKPEKEIPGEVGELELIIGKNYDIRIETPRWFSKKRIIATPVENN